MPTKSISVKREFIGGDRSLWMVILILCLTSILVVYSSTASMAYRKLDGDTSYYLARQIKFVLLGLGIIFAVHHVNYGFYFRHAKSPFICILVAFPFFSPYMPLSPDVDMFVRVMWVCIKKNYFCTYIYIYLTLYIFIYIVYYQMLRC